MIYDLGFTIYGFMIYDLNKEADIDSAFLFRSDLNENETFLIRSDLNENGGDLRFTIYDL